MTIEVLSLANPSQTGPGPVWVPVESPLKYRLTPISVTQRIKYAIKSLWKLYRHLLRKMGKVDVSKAALVMNKVGFENGYFIQ